MSRGGSGTAIILRRITGRHTSRPIYTRQQTHAGVHRPAHAVQTHNDTPPGTMSRATTKAERWIVLLYQFPLLLRKKAMLGSPISTFTYSTYSMFTDTHDGQRNTVTVHKHTPGHMTHTLISGGPPLPENVPPSSVGLGLTDEKKETAAILDPDRREVLFRWSPFMSGSE